MRDGVEVTGHGVREQVRPRKLPRRQVVVQLVGVPHGYEDTLGIIPQAEVVEPGRDRLLPIVNGVHRLDKVTIFP